MVRHTGHRHTGRYPNTTCRGIIRTTSPNGSALDATRLHGPILARWG